MQIPRSLLDELTEELNALSDAGRQMVENALSKIIPELTDEDGLVTGENVAALRDLSSEVMMAVCEELTDLSVSRATEFYEEVRKLSVGKRLGGHVETPWNPEATEGAVRALVQSVAKTGLTDQFVRELCDRVDREIKEASGESVKRNAHGDPLKPRWARVPSGAETCPFCIMLASRGFMYHTEESAAKGRRGHYHPNCDCRIVPGFKGDQVEGYDLDDLCRQYINDLKDGKLNLKGVSKYSSHTLHWGSEQFKSYGDFLSFISKATDIEDLQHRCAVVEQEWLKTGLSEGYYSRLKQLVLNKRSFLLGDAFYEKPRSELQDHEKKGIDWLLKHGIRPTVKQENPTAKANLDFEIDGEPWEMKNVTNARSSVSNQMSRAKKKWRKLKLDEPVRIVITTVGCSDSFEDVVEAVKSKAGYDEAIVVSETSICRIRK